MNTENVFSKLAAARDQFHKLLHDKTVQKSGYNKFLDSFYFELGDIVPPGLKCLHDNGLCVTPMRSNGLEVSMSVVEIDTGQSIDFAIPAGKANIKGAHEIQGLGAALTYSRRYLWLNLLEVVEPEVIENSEPKESLKPGDPATEPQLQLLREAYKAGKLSDAAAKKLKEQLDSAKGVTVKEASALIESLRLKEGSE